MKETHLISRDCMKKISSILGAFCLPVAILVLVMAYLGITPFGDITVLIWDAKIQYKDYLGYTWDVLHGNAGNQYAFSKSLGGGIVGILGYYCSSFLNLFLFFFKKSQIPLFMAFAMILRMGLSGVTCNHYLFKRFNLNYPQRLLISTAYALCEYNVYYCRNCMWLDGVIFLPIVALGIWYVVKELRSGVLCWAIGTSIICNWYTGYMLCYFAFILFLTELLYSYCDKERGDGRCKCLKTVLIFLKSVLEGVGLSAFILIPSCCALISGKATHNRTWFSNRVNFDPIHFIAAFDIRSKVNSSTAPVVYCTGLLCILFVLYFFLENNLKRKVLIGLITAFLVLCFCLRELELSWTGFVESHSYYFRFSFVFTFFMVFVAAAGLDILNTIKSIPTEVCVRVSVFILILIYMLVRMGEVNTTGKTLIFYTLLMVVYVWVAKYLNQCQGIPRIGLYVVLFIGVVGELFYNTKWAFKDYSLSYAQYADYYEQVEDVLTELKSDDQSFYRFEKTISYNSISGSDAASCESMLFGYQSIEHYSSAYDIDVDRLLAAVGYSDWVDGSEFLLETYWNSPMVAMESLLSCKYILWDEPTYGYKVARDDIFDGEQIKLFENEYCLPLGFMVSDEAGELYWEDNPFKNQDTLYDMLLGKNIDLYHDVLCEVHESNDVEDIWKLRVADDGPLYVYPDGKKAFNDHYAKNATLYVDGEEKQGIMQRFLINAIYLGEYCSGDEVEVKIVKNNKTSGKDIVLHAATLDKKEFQKAIIQLKDGSETEWKMMNNSIEGVCHIDKGGTLFLSIPYEKNWKFSIDGENVDAKNIAGLVGINIGSGEHIVSAKYTAPGVVIGRIVSVFSLLLILCIHGSDRSRKHAMCDIKGNRCS